MLKVQSDWDRITARLDIADCWEWKLSTDKDGYGKTHTGSAAQGTMRHVHVHRFMYEALVGPIPEGLVLDHLCRNRKCCNPDHLEAVTVAQNVRRGALGQRKTCRPLGHSLADAYRRVDGTRTCRPCHLAKGRARRAKQQ